MADGRPDTLTGAPPSRGPGADGGAQKRRAGTMLERPQEGKPDTLRGTRGGWPRRLPAGKPWPASAVGWSGSMHLAWLTDIHLNCLEDDARRDFAAAVAATGADGVV